MARQNMLHYAAGHFELSNCSCNWLCLSLASFGICYLVDKTMLLLTKP